MPPPVSCTDHTQAPTDAQGSSGWSGAVRLPCSRALSVVGPLPGQLRLTPLRRVSVSSAPPDARSPTVPILPDKNVGVPLTAHRFLASAAGTPPTGRSAEQRSVARYAPPHAHPLAVSRLRSVSSSPPPHKQNKSWQRPHAKHRPCLGHQLWRGPPAHVDEQPRHLPWAVPPARRPAAGGDERRGQAAPPRRYLHHHQPRRSPRYRCARRRACR